MRQKTFFLPAEAIKRDLAPPQGYCIAADTITVQGKLVGFMYREKADHPDDSGWRFFCGEESDEYCSDPANFALYDVNTIANYDPAIIPFLDYQVGSAFERNPESGFVATEFPEQ